MKAVFVVYDIFAHFEVVLASNFLRYVGEADYQETVDFFKKFIDVDS